MLNKVFVEFLYEAAHIQRWNDHIRPNGFTELDKQAHKMMILYAVSYTHLTLPTILRV